MRGFHLKQTNKPIDFRIVCMRDMNSQCSEILLPYVIGAQGNLLSKPSYPHNYVTGDKTIK